MHPHFLKRKSGAKLLLFFHICKDLAQKKRRSALFLLFMYQYCPHEVADGKWKITKIWKNIIIICIYQKNVVPLQRQTIKSTFYENETFFLHAGNSSMRWYCTSQRW